MNALQGQQAHRPGQSEATPWVDMPWSGNALQGQKRFSPVQLRFCPFRAFIAITSQTQGVDLGYVRLGFQPVLSLGQPWLPLVQPRLAAVFVRLKAFAAGRGRDATLPEAAPAFVATFQVACCLCIQKNIFVSLCLYVQKKGS